MKKKLEQNSLYLFIINIQINNFFWIYMSRIHWITRGTGTPKDRDEVSIGVMKDSKINLRDLHVSHTLGCTRDWNP